MSMMNPQIHSKIESAIKSPGGTLNANEAIFSRGKRLYYKTPNVLINNFKFNQKPKDNGNNINASTIMEWHRNK